MPCEYAVLGSWGGYVWTCLRILQSFCNFQGQSNDCTILSFNSGKQTLIKTSNIFKSFNKQVLHFIPLICMCIFYSVIVISWTLKSVNKSLIYCHHVKGRLWCMTNSSTVTLMRPAFRSKCISCDSLDNGSASDQGKKRKSASFYIRVPQHL
jgi:hypothetical protein